MEGVINLGRDALKTLLLINGGAAIAVLAFIGQITSRSSKELIPALAPVLGWFVFGAIVCGLTTVLAFVSTAMLAIADESFKGEEPDIPFEKWPSTIKGMGVGGVLLVIITIAGGLLACFCFARGAYIAVETLRTFAW